MMISKHDGTVSALAVTQWCMACGTACSSEGDLQVM